jgi:Leucine Rich Repeat (LRR) protein
MMAITQSGFSFYPQAKACYDKREYKQATQICLDAIRVMDKCGYMFQILKDSLVATNKISRQTVDSFACGSSFFTCMFAQGLFEEVTQLCLVAIALEFNTEMTSDQPFSFLTASLIAQNRLSDVSLIASITDDFTPIHFEITSGLVTASNQITQLYLQVRVQSGNELQKLFTGIHACGCLRKLTFNIQPYFEDIISQRMLQIKERLQRESYQVCPVMMMRSPEGVKDYYLPYRQEIFETALKANRLEVESDTLREYKSSWPIVLLNLNRSLTHLAIVGSKMGNEGGYALGNWLRENTALCGLDLSGSLFDKAASDAIFKALYEKGIKLKALNMSGNWVCDCLHLSRLLTVAKNLQELNLANDLAYSATSLARAAEIGRVLSQKQPRKLQLIVLILDGEHKWHISEMQVFAKWLATQPVQKLSLKGNTGLGIETLKVLANALKGHAHLRSLDLQGVNIHVDVQISLKRFLPRVTINFV